MSLLVLLLAALGWEVSGWLVAQVGLAEGALLQQALLFALWLTALERWLPHGEHDD